MSKLTTPDWVLKGKKKPTKKSEGKTFRIKKCPKCKSDKVSVVLTGEEEKNRGESQCGKCKWKGTDIQEEELNEEQFMKYIDKK